MLDRNGRKVNKIRHIRCYGKNVANPVRVKRHTYPSEKEYKQHILAALGDGSVYALCEYTNGQTTEYKRYTYMEISENRKSGIEDIPTVYPDKKGQPLQLARKIMKGDMLLIYEKTPDELLHLDKSELSKRLYKVQYFEGERKVTIFHHLLSDSSIKAKQEGEEKKRNKGESIKDYTQMPPIIRCSITGISFLQKNVDFEFTKDGIILKHI